MSVALALPRPTDELTVVSSLRRESAEWTAEQVRLIKFTLTSNLTDAEFALFAQVCHRSGLDPFTRQIYAIKRRQNLGGSWSERMTIQTGIDGYRVTAERTGEYAGGDAPKYGAACKCDDKQFGPHPQWAEVVVRRVKCGETFSTAERADFHEYVVLSRDGSPQGLWAKMPKRMLAKCAEALALRRAFPALLHGVYTAKEMAQADVVATEVIDVAPTTEKISPELAETPVTTQTPEADATERPGLLDGSDQPYGPKVGDPCIECRETRLSADIYRVGCKLRILALSSDDVACGDRA